MASVGRCEDLCVMTWATPARCTTSAAARRAPESIASPVPSGSTHGYSYLLLLVLAAVLALVSAGTVSVGHAVSHAHAEKELLAIGAEFRAALQSYGGSASFMPGGQWQRPAQLQELMRDPHVPGVRRHLRRIYADPLSGRADWGVVRGPDGRIAGIYSLAPGVPVKRAGFDPASAHFENAKSYADWVFMGFAPVQLTPRSVP